MKPINDLSKLHNLGAKSAEMLAKTGICTAQDLRQLGAVQAYLRVIESGSKPSLNLLWAIEGALTDRDRRDIARDEALPLLLALEDAQKPVP